jgi:hypothetical protein
MERRQPEYASVYQNMHYKALTLPKYVLQGTVACSKWTAYCSNW